MIGQSTAPVQLDERLLSEIGRELRIAREAIQVADQAVEVAVEQLHHLVLE